MSLGEASQCEAHRVALGIWNRCGPPAGFIRRYSLGFSAFGKRLAAAAGGGSHHIHLKGYSLQGGLLVNVLQEIKSLRHGRFDAFQPDFKGLSDKLRVNFRHFAIQGEREVGVEFFLQLEKLLSNIAPRTLLDHHQQNFGNTRVKPDKIDHSGMFEAFG